MLDMLQWSPLTAMMRERVRHAGDRFNDARRSMALERARQSVRSDRYHGRSLRKGETVIQLDLRGKVCPYPTTEVYRRFQDLPPGDRIEVLSDYVPARFTVPALVKDLGGTSELRDGEGGLFTIVIEKPATTSSRGG